MRLLRRHYASRSTLLGTRRSLRRRRLAHRWIALLRLCLSLCLCLRLGLGLSLGLGLHPLHHLGLLLRHAALVHREALHALRHHVIVLGKVLGRDALRHHLAVGVPGVLLRVARHCGRCCQRSFERDIDAMTMIIVVE